jgi:hypothetical protein
MAMFLENVGLGFLDDDDNENLGAISGIIGEVAQRGTPIVGYSGSIYFHKKFGATEIYAGAVVNPDEKEIQLHSFYTQVSGKCVWKCRISSADVQPLDASLLDRRCMIERTDGGGMTIINIVCADVLPSYLENDEITMQVVAFPLVVEYFLTEDDYADSVPADAFGKRMLLAPGTVFPLTFLDNHNPEHEERRDNDDCVHICGVVKQLRYGKTMLGEGIDDIHFISSTIETAYGDLDIIHSIDAVSDKQRDAVKVGSTVVAYGVLQGDVAIYDYENGAIFDEEHDLRLLRFFFEKGGVERLSAAFAENVQYHSDYKETTYSGRDDVLERLKYVHNVRANKYFAHMATISEVDGKDLEYAVGKRCVVLQDEKESDYESVVFIDVNDKGKIAHMHITTESRYHFTIDKTPEPNDIFSDMQAPTDFIEPMTIRAVFHMLIDGDTDIIDTSDRDNEFDNNAVIEISTLKENENFDSTAIEKAFARLFVRDAERVGMSAEKLVYAKDKGKQFYKDFSHYAPDSGSDEYWKDLHRAFVFVQRLGELMIENDANSSN